MNMFRQAVEVEENDGWANLYTQLVSISNHASFDAKITVLVL
jgi:plastocyanin domain-containing protein